jgi:NADH pyrophosphatase NudC (nudix superfamily)
MCGQKGFLLSVSKNGLCKSCDQLVVMDVQQRGQIINDCMKLVDKSKNIKTRLSRCDLLIEHAQALSEYEDKGISTVDPSPSQLLSQYTAIRAQLVGEGKKPNAESAANTCPYCGSPVESTPKRKARCPHCGGDIYVRSNPYGLSSLVSEADAACLDWLKSFEVSVKQYKKIQKATEAKSLRDIIIAIQQESRKSDLLNHKRNGVKKVEIYGALDDRMCQACLSLHNKQLRIDEALNAQPLPVRDCANSFCRCVYLAVVD